MVKTDRKSEWTILFFPILLILLRSLSVSNAQQDISQNIPSEIENNNQEYRSALSKAQSVAQSMLEEKSQTPQINERFSAANLIGGFIFSGIGFIAFTYGKKMSNFKSMALGFALLIYPYFISSTVIMYIVGLLLCFVLYVFKD